MEYRADSPLVVQSDRTVLLEVSHPRFTEARNFLAAFAEIERSPEHIHTYRISPLSLWNSAAAGHSATDLLTRLDEYSKFPVPGNVRTEIENWMSRWGALTLTKKDGAYVLEAKTPALMKEIRSRKSMATYLIDERGPKASAIDPGCRGHLKMELINVGWPVKDLAGYREGAEHPFTMRSITTQGEEYSSRDYQTHAADAFHAGGSAEGGAGVIVLPCGAGKTIVGIEIMRRVGKKTLILITNVVAARQWRAELLDKTDLREEDIGEYSGERKEIKPVTLATYQILTHRKSRTSAFSHFSIFDSEDWGLIIYDEVHLLPAPVFRFTAELQSRRRLGLTATLVREDGKENEVFSLIGPKRYDIPWRDLERQGWIAAADCCEMRVRLPENLENAYAIASDRERFRIASENPVKDSIVSRLLDRHKGDHVLIIGQYLDQLKRVADRVGSPILTGKTPTRERQRLYESFRRGELPVLTVSRVANFAVDLPDANVAIEISGLFGSRQEEAQRLGRILRPKDEENRAHFYILVSRNTCEESFAQKRQLFLVEQGYKYDIEIADAAS